MFPVQAYPGDGYRAAIGVVGGIAQVLVVQRRPQVVRQADAVVRLDDLLVGVDYSLCIVNSL